MKQIEKGPDSHDFHYDSPIQKLSLSAYLAAALISQQHHLRNFDSQSFGYVMRKILISAEVITNDGVTNAGYQFEESEFQAIKGLSRKQNRIQRLFDVHHEHGHNYLFAAKRIRPTGKLKAVHEFIASVIALAYLKEQILKSEFGAERQSINRQ